MQLGHLPGQCCHFLKLVTKGFLILDVMSVYEVNVDFCGYALLPKCVQLLCACCWPTTPQQPYTVATFHLLNLFGHLNVQAKTNAHDFWQVL